ncbi:MAG: FkbM family methyltransferase [Ferruginibacter sp.]|nr:FkbM family methyltransferase [Ferruginibacter sp.]
MNSLRFLYQAPYNKKFPVFALYRFVYWKLIRVFKLKDVKYRLWDNRAIFLNYDSFQSMWIMYNYYVDWEEFNLISKYIQPGDEVFDIGANMGFYTIWMSRFISTGTIHSFEPDPLNFKRLQKNIALNNLQNRVIANNKAAGDLDGELGFTHGLDGENHIVDQGEQNAVTILSQKIESYVEQHNILAIAYMKIDVEGFEYAVLKGTGTFLSNKKIDIIQLEINKSIGYSGIKISDLLDLLNDNQYSLCSYGVSENQLIVTGFSNERENYFAVHNLQKINLKLKSVARK